VRFHAACGSWGGSVLALRAGGPCSILTSFFFFVHFTTMSILALETIICFLFVVCVIFLFFSSFFHTRERERIENTPIFYNSEALRIVGIVSPLISRTQFQRTSQVAVRGLLLRYLSLRMICPRFASRIRAAHRRTVLMSQSLLCVFCRHWHRLPYTAPLSRL
jgi:hypothetical protein